MIYTAEDLQNGFKAGLMICGQEEGELEWIGNQKNWDLLKRLEGEEFYSDRTARDYE